MRREIVVSALASEPAAIAAGFQFGTDAAEFGAGPWIKGGTDLRTGVVPSQPGFYSRTDVYHYEAAVSAVVFNGRVEVGVDQEIRHPTGGDVRHAVEAFWRHVRSGHPTQHHGRQCRCRHSTAPVHQCPSATASARLRWKGETSILPSAIPGLFRVMLGWDVGIFHWSGALFVLAPTGDYSTRQLANTSLNRWALMPRLAATYFDPKSGWQVNGVAVYAVSCRNDATNYNSATSSIWKVRSSRISAGLELAQSATA